MKRSTFTALTGVESLRAREIDPEVRGHAILRHAGHRVLQRSVERHEQANRLVVAVQAASDEELRERERAAGRKYYVSGPECEPAHGIERRDVVPALGGEKLVRHV